MPRIEKAERLLGIQFNFTIGTTAGASYVSKFTISAGYNFVWELTQAVKWNASGVPDSILNPSIRDVFVNIRDEYTSEDMFVNPVSLALVTGQGAYQYVLPRPYVFRGGTTITVTVIDAYGGAEGFNLQIVLLGYKIYGAIPK